MESADANRELLENVTISDVNGSQYMIQRMSVENAHLLNGDLLTHHAGLVVDIGATDFIPVNYTSEDLQQLTEEDRNLAAALVAVQFSQQQKQQQQHQQIHQDSNTVLGSGIQDLVSTGTTLDETKVINEQQLILSEKNASELNEGYLHIVGTGNIYETYDAQSPNIKSDEVEVEFKDSDGENRSDNRSSRKSLPHKKRISRKLIKKAVSSRKCISKCTLCEQSFTTLDEYLQHQQICRTTITPISSIFSCQICQETFSNQLHFFEHLKSHYEPTDNQIQTNEANDSSSKGDSKPDSDSTKTSSMLSSLLNLHCIQCDKSFRRQKAYEAHIREMHTSSRVDLNEFSGSDDFMNGIDVVVDENDNDSEDDESKNWSKYRDDELQATEEDLKELEAQDHVCHICKEPFPIRTILLQHLTACRAANSEAETVNGTPKKKSRKKSSGDLTCVVCGRVFTHRNSLVYHMRSHTGDRPHQCEHCGKSFFAASALKVHKRLHSGDKPYKCEECGRHFRQWGDLKYHTISLHSDTKQYQCEYCGKDFARKYSLIVHRRIHTGEKNYKCEFCSKSFRASSYLQNHRRIHTGEKPHTCEVCGKPFRVRSDMKRHMKTHGRRRINRISQDIVVTKMEEGVENPESILPDTEDCATNESNIPKIESVQQVISYEQDPLEVTRDANTLYSQGPQFFVLYADAPVRSSNEGSNSSWIQSS